MKNFKSFINKIALVFCMVLVFGVLGSSNVSAANIGDKLVSPESAWQRIDSVDSKISYIGTGWVDYTNQSNGLNGTTERFCFIKSNQIKFKFYGTALRLIESKNSDRVDTYVSIDGVEYSYNSYNSDLIYQYLTFQKLNLNLGVHEVIVYNKEGFINNKHALGLDAIDIDSTGKLLPCDYTNLTATLSNANSTITLNWNKVDGATGYNVKRSTTQGTAYTTITSNITGTSYNDTTVQAGTTYYYVVEPIVNGSEGTQSSEASAIIPKTEEPNATGNAILTITMTNGNVKSYTVPMTKVNDFISWYDNRVSGSSGKAYYTFDKTDNLQPFTKKTEYLVFDKISSYEVDEYTK